MTDQVQLSTTDWVREQTEKILQQGTTDGVQVFDRPIVLFTVIGAKTGLKRYVPLMRVERDGSYAMVGSIGGAPKHPTWYHNVKANPNVIVQDGDKVFQMTAREVHGAGQGIHRPGKGKGRIDTRHGCRAVYPRRRSVRAIWRGLARAAHAARSRTGQTRRTRHTKANLGDGRKRNQINREPDSGVIAARIITMHEGRE